MNGLPENDFAFFDAGILAGFCLIVQWSDSPAVCGRLLPVDCAVTQGHRWESPAPLPHKRR